MRRAKQLRWSKRANFDLAKIRVYAPSEAVRVIQAMEWQAQGGWSLGHPIGRGSFRWWAVPPWGVVYRVTSIELIVARVHAVRRLRRPIP